MLTGHQRIALLRVAPKMKWSENGPMLGFRLGDVEAFVNQDGFFKIAANYGPVDPVDESTLLRAMDVLEFKEWGDDAISAGISRMLGQHGL